MLKLCVPAYPMSEKCKRTGFQMCGDIKHLKHTDNFSEVEGVSLYLHEK